MSVADEELKDSWWSVFRRWPDEKEIEILRKVFQDNGITDISMVHRHLVLKAGSIANKDKT
jgi:hypothetical protein